jgi:shikimate kinase
MRSIFLVGFMGAGKSSVGRVLADRMGRPFVDLDEVLSRRFGATIAEVFDRHGEAAFRAAEREELQLVARQSGTIVSTGGGAFCDPENRLAIHQADGISVFLEVPWPVLAARLASDDGARPLFNSLEQAKALLDSRLPSYRQAAIVLEIAADETPARTAERLAVALEEVACAT